MIDSDTQAGTPGKSFQVTPAMIAAGVYAAKECCLGEGLEVLVFKVFVAMKTEESDLERPSVVDQARQVDDKKLRDC
jgi:hypothetical protein